MKHKVILVGVVVLVMLAGAAGYQWYMGTQNMQHTMATNVSGYNLNSMNFNLVDVDGNQVSKQNLLGKPSLIFFGYTNCPDVCPISMFSLRGWLDTVEPQQDFNLWFVSIDPERDTAQLLKEFTARFHPELLGIRGTDEQTQQVLKQFGIYAKKQEVTQIATPTNNNASSAEVEIQSMAEAGDGHNHHAEHTEHDNDHADDHTDHADDHTDYADNHTNHADDHTDYADVFTHNHELPPMMNAVIDHSSPILMFKSDGAYFGQINFGAESSEALPKLREFFGS